MCWARCCSGSRSYQLQNAERPPTSASRSRMARRQSKSVSSNGTSASVAPGICASVRQAARMMSSVRGPHHGS